MRIHLDTIGCRLNTGEMETLARQLSARGHRVVGPGDTADLVVFNTCAVTHVASRKSRKQIRLLRRRHHGAGLVATGCFSELDPVTTRSLGVDLVVPNRHKDRIAEVMEEHGLLSSGDPIPDLAASPFPVAHRTRAFVKVQDGCDNRCTFCVVTIARGEGRSRPLRDVVKAVEGRVAAGFREVVLSGVHLGSWGRDCDEPGGLRRLVEAVLDRTTIERLRLSSLEPWDLDPDFFSLWENPRLQPHLHLPLQSGCDITLRRMARRTSQATFATLVTGARAEIPDLSVSTDIIIGFPGEDDAEFEDSTAFIKKMFFSRLHIFRYSPRAGTAAAHLPGQVKPEVMAQRSHELHAAGARMENDFRQGHVGRTMDVLWEDSDPEATSNRRRWYGLTGNYLRVVSDTSLGVSLRNRVLPTYLRDSSPCLLYGDILGIDQSMDTAHGPCS